MSKRYIAIVILIILGFYNFSFSQSDRYGFPFVKNYTPQEYIGSNQNFSIVQDKKGTIYFGNNPSILSYDGARWKAIESTNFSASLSMDIDTTTGIIYVGLQNDFGYLSVGNKGQMVYTSLLNLIPEKYNDFNDVWYTYLTKDGVYFISNYLIVRIKNGKSKLWENENGQFHTAFKIDNKIILRTREEGLKIITKDKIETIAGSEIFKNERVDFILPYKNNEYLLGSRKLGLYSMQLDFTNLSLPKCILNKLSSNSEPFLLQNEMTRAIKLHNGNYAIGTLKGGAIVIDSNLNTVSVIDDKISLQDLQVSYLFEDAQNNLWLALDNGISVVEISSPFNNLTAENGLKGSVRSLIRYKEDIYFATSQGVFVYKKGANIVSPALEKTIETWDLLEFNSHSLNPTIIIASGGGVFEICNGIKNKISEKRTYKIIQPVKFKNIIYLGLYSGFEVMQKVGNTWVSLGTIDNFDSEVRDIDEDNFGNVWLCTQIDGLRYLENKNSIGGKPNFVMTKYDTLNGLPSNIDNFIYKLKNKFVVNTATNQFYNIQQTKKGTKKYYVFSPDTLIDKKFYDENRLLIKLSEDKNSNIWMQTFFNKSQTFDNGIALYQKNNRYKWYNKPFKRLPQSQFYSILAEPNGVTWFAGNDGVISYNNNIKFNYSKKFSPVISFILSNKDTIFKGEFYKSTKDSFTGKEVYTSSSMQPNELKLKLSFQNNNITFLFAATSYITSENNKFSYFLEGNDEVWSDWSKKTEKYYTNLSEGNYIFRLKSKDVFDNVSQEITYEFTILPPWYRTIWAYIIYSIIGVIVIYLIVKFYTKSLKRIIDFQTSELRQQNKEIEHKNKEITDSIFYAKKIQEAIMPSSSFINELFPESFVLFKPKDIVSGDFYWATQKNNKILIAAADCTGHGVPGAFMSMLGNDNLNEIVIDRNTLEPNEILNGARLGIIKALKQKGESGENKDGMDIAMLVYDRENLKLEYSGANNPLYIIRKNSHSPFVGYSYNIVQDRYSLLEIKGNKFPVGIYINNELPPFTSHTLQLEKGDTFYIFSDGFADQFGGEAGKKFKYNKLKELLLSIQELPLPEQSRVLEDTFYNWKGNLEQVDDVLLIGMRVN